MTYSIDYRHKVLSIREKEKLTIAETAKRFGIGAATIVRWLNRVEPRRTRIKPATKIDRIALARDVHEFPDAYQAERAKRLGCSVQGIGHALKRMGVTYKKSTKPSQGRPRRMACLPKKYFTTSSGPVKHFV